MRNYVSYIGEQTGLKNFDDLSSIPEKKTVVKYDSFLYPIKRTADLEQRHSQKNPKRGASLRTNLRFQGQETMAPKAVCYIGDPRSPAFESGVFKVRIDNQLTGSSRE